MRTHQAIALRHPEVTEAIVLAGGAGTRLRSVLPDLPKPMAPIRGRPFLAYLLDNLVAHGLQRVILSVGYRRERIWDFFGDGYGGLAIDYVIEEQPLGTGGAIARALPLLNGAEGFVLNGDTYLHLDLRAMAAAYRESGDGNMMMALHQVPDATRYGRVDVVNGYVQGFFSGSGGAGTINAGVYLLPRNLFDGHSLPACFSFEKDFLLPEVETLRPRAFPCNGVFVDIGVPEGYAEAQRILSVPRSDHP